MPAVGARKGSMEFKFNDPATDFSNGLQVLKTYHEDFLARGARFIELAKNIQQQGMTEALANDCMDMYCHYSHATHLHHKDEEEALFPILIEQSSLVLGMIERLMLDHEEIEESWNKLAKQLINPENITNYDYLLHQTTEFEQILREHLTREDEDFSPLVKKILSEEQMQQIGQKMHDLRHLNS